MSITYAQFEEMEKCRKTLMSALQHEMDRRPTAYSDQWVENERQAITDAANRWAVSHPPLTTVSTAQVEQVEREAVGYSDYARKFVLYVSELLYQV